MVDFTKMNKAHKDGVEAGKANKPLSANPYKEDVLRSQWMKGWKVGKGK